MIKYFLVAGYIFGHDSSILISAMRNGVVDELFATLSSIEKNQDSRFNKCYELDKQSFITMLVGSYNRPEPSVPMDPIVISEQVLDLMKRKKH